MFYSGWNLIFPHFTYKKNNKFLVLNLLKVNWLIDWLIDCLYRGSWWSRLMVSIVWCIFWLIDWLINCIEEANGAGWWYPSCSWVPCLAAHWGQDHCIRSYTLLKPSPVHDGKLTGDRIIASAHIRSINLVQYMTVNSAFNALVKKISIDTLRFTNQVTDTNLVIRPSLKNTSRLFHLV